MTHAHSTDEEAGAQRSQEKPFAQMTQPWGETEDPKLEPVQYPPAMVAAQGLSNGKTWVWLVSPRTSQG